MRLAREVDERERLIVADLGDRPPGADARAAKQASAFHMFPIPATVLWLSSASPMAAWGRRRAGGAGTALVEALADHVRAEPRELRRRARAGVAHQLQHRPAVLDRPPPPATQHDPCAAQRAGRRQSSVAPGSTTAGHAQVRVDASARPRSARRGACRVRRRPRPRGLRAARASRPCWCAVAAPGSPRVPGPRTGADAVAPRGGSCRPRASPLRW